MGRTSDPDFPDLEPLIAKIDAIREGVASFEMYMPGRCTYQGHRVCGAVPKAIMLDRFLRRGLVPVRSKPEEDGHTVRFERASSGDVWKPRTEAPSLDITQQIPALTPLVKSTTRLHPRRSTFQDATGSKMGGTFLWPRAEPWPHCDDQRHKDVDGGECPSLTALVQLQASDFPEISFRPGADLLQLLWCPPSEDVQVHDDCYIIPRLFAYWRNSKSIADPISSGPLPAFGDSLQNFFPISCRFHPERVDELPTPAGLYELPNHDELHDALTADNDIWYLYQSDLCACPSTKLGGHPYWIQNDDTPTCGCGARMDFLLQLVDWEYTQTLRWVPKDVRWAVGKERVDPIAEAVLRPPLFDFRHDLYYVFVCRQCSEWPVQLVGQH